MEEPLMWITKREVEAAQNVFIRVQYAVDKGNNQLNARINDLRHLMNDQLIELKYGKGSIASFLDEILIQINNL